MTHLKRSTAILMTSAILALAVAAGIGAAWISQRHVDKSRDYLDSAKERAWSEELRRAETLSEEGSLLAAVSTYKRILSSAPDRFHDTASHSLARTLKLVEDRIAKQTEAGDQLRGQVKLAEAIRVYQDAHGLSLQAKNVAITDRLRDRIAETVDAESRVAEYRQHLRIGQERLAAEEYEQAVAQFLKAKQTICFASEPDALIRSCNDVQLRRVHAALEKVEAAAASPDFDALNLSLREFDVLRDVPAEIAAKRRKLTAELAQLWHGEATAAWDRGESQRAIEKCRKALTLDPTNQTISSSITHYEQQLHLQEARACLWSGKYERVKKIVAKAAPGDGEFARLFEEANTALNFHEVARVRVEHVDQLGFTQNGEIHIIARDRILRWLPNIQLKQIATVPRLRGALEFSPSGNVFANGRNGRLICAAFANPRRSLELRGFQGELAWVRWSNNKQIVAITSENELLVFDVKERKLVTRLRLPQLDSAIRSFAVSPNGSRCAVGYQSGRVYLIKRLLNEPTRILLERGKSPQFGAITSLSISPDSNTLAIGTASGVIRCWVISANVENIVNRRKSSAEIVSTAFSPDGGWFVASSSDLSVMVWKLGVVEPRTLPRQDVPITKLALDSRSLATWSRGTMKLWDLPEIFR